jgi:hypothetical protein
LEIIENIIRNMDLNYQWIIIRKKYNLIHSPINLDFNIENYTYICNKYLSDLTIVFLYGYDKHKETEFWTLPEKLYLLVTKNNSLYKKQLTDIKGHIDIFYCLNNGSISSLKDLHWVYPIYYNNTNQIINYVNTKRYNDIKVIDEEIRDYSIYEHNINIYYNTFIKKVVKNKKWRTISFMDDFWNTKLDISNIKNYGDYELNRWNKNPIIYNDIINNTIDPTKQITFKNFIKKITLMRMNVGIFIDGNICFCNENGNNLIYYETYKFFIININHLNGNYDLLPEIKNIYHKIFKNIISVNKLIEKYGNIILNKE